MPVLQFTAFDHQFEDKQQAADLIERLTDAVRDTQVILTGVSPKLWGLGGNPAG
jgi:phenylpyruvate tautomerase PptA (4-oxalocrotonate tautomerase family)